MIVALPMNAHPTLTLRAGALPPRLLSGLPREPLVLYAAWSVVLIAGYFAIDAASFVFWVDPIPVKPWNPQAGLAVAFVYAGGARYAWPVFVAALGTEVVLRGVGASLGGQLFSAAAVAVPLTLTGLVLRLRTTDRDWYGVAAVRDFLLIAAAGAALTAAFYVIAYVVMHQHTLASLYSSVLHKWLGDLTGIVIVAPLTILLITPAWTRRPAQPLWFDVLAFVATLAAVVYLLFSGDSEAGERPFYLLFVPLIVLAMRRGLPGAVLGVAIVQVAILLALWLAGRSVEEATSYQMLMLVLGVTTLVLGAVSGERRRALSELARRSAELRAQQQALSDAMRFSAASETAATLAHELSQPLSAIGTYARAGLEMLKRGLSKPADLTGVMERIVAEASRTRESVQRIRDFFRTGILRREPIELASVVADAADAMRDRLRTLSISLSIDVPDTLPPLSADPIQLRTVLHNLVGNAADAVADTPAPRWIRIVAHERAAHVDVEVADSGPGIDASLRDLLFEPLVTTKPSGMGLGLSISRTLVQAHGGTLELAATHPTTFRFSLPIHGNAAQQ